MHQHWRDELDGWGTGESRIMAEKGVMGNSSAVGLKMAPRAPILLAICCSLEKERHDMACAYSAPPVPCPYRGRDWIKCECLKLLTDRRARKGRKILGQQWQWQVRQKIRTPKRGLGGGQ